METFSEWGVQHPDTKVRRLSYGILFGCHAGSNFPFVGAYSLFVALQPEQIDDPLSLVKQNDPAP